jgi:long-chain acyl-CoA synthetase
VYPGAHVAQHPDKPAIVMADTGQTLSYAELEDHSIRLARVFAEAGLSRGDHVAILSDNSPEVFECYWAGLRSGLYVTAVNIHLSAAEVAYIVDDCGARVLVVSAGSPAVAELAEAIVEQTPEVELRLAFDGELPGHRSSPGAPTCSTPQAPPAGPRGSRGCCPTGRSTSPVT